MDQIPAAMDRHLDVIQCHKDGGILLGASGLTGRYWFGSLWFYDDPDNAPDVEKCTAGVQLEAGLNDAVWVDNNKVLVGLDTGGVAVWELVDNFHTFVHQMGALEHDDIVTSVTVANGNARAVSSSADNCIKVWDLENMKSTYTYRAHWDAVECVSCHPSESSLFLSCSQDGRTFLWDTRKCKPVTVLDTSPLQHSPKYITWQPGSPHIYAVGDETGHIVVKDTRVDIGIPKSFTPHSRAITKLEFSQQNPELLASTSEDCSIVVTSIGAETYQQRYRDSSHSDFVQGLSWKDDVKLFTCSWDSQIKSHSLSGTKNKSQKSDPEPVVMEINGEPDTKDSVMQSAQDEVKCNSNSAVAIEAT